MEIVFLIIGLALGFLTGYLVVSRKKSSDPGIEPQVNLLNQELQQQKEEGIRLRAALDVAKETEQKLSDLSDTHLQTVRDLEREKAEKQAVLDRLNEQKADLENLQKKFTLEFENIANRLLEEKSKKFTDQNRENLGHLLNPLSERIKDFERKVNEVYLEESKERASLKQQIQHLSQLNQQMSLDAQNLTNALKGNTKKQGNWGEFILESILERSGLVKEREYQTQQSLKAEDGSRFQPDVVVNLPDEKHLVIDSKVSLVAYERFVNSDDPHSRDQALKEHVASLKAHIKGLSDKNYQNLYGLKSLDFVLLFVPIEPAFAAAIQAESTLFQDAFDKNIVIVSPTTLLATLRTVASIWRQENQSRNALEIARRSGSLYDKFVGFIDDMERIKNSLDQALKHHENAMGKLSQGRGNLIKSAEDIRKLGAKATKNLPERLMDDSIQDDDSDE